MITNSRQNTRFRWKDAEKLEKFANGIDDDSNITFPGNIVVDSADNIVDKEGNPIVSGGGGGAGGREVIELTPYTLANKEKVGQFKTEEDLYKVWDNPSAYIGHISRTTEGNIKDFGVDVYVEFALQRTGTNSYNLCGSFIGQGLSIAGDTSISSSLSIVVIFYRYKRLNSGNTYFYNLSYLNQETSQYNVWKCTFDNVRYNNSVYKLVVYLNGYVESKNSNLAVVAALFYNNYYKGNIMNMFLTNDDGVYYNIIGANAEDTGVYLYFMNPDGTAIVNTVVQQTLPVTEKIPVHSLGW